MVKYSNAALDATFGALADPVRRAVLARLAKSDSSVSELAEPFPISLPGFSKHLQVLVRAGLVSTAKDGRVRRCRLEAEAMHSAADWIEHYRAFWEEQFEALAKHLAESENDAHSNAKKKEKKNGNSKSRP